MKKKQQEKFIKDCKFCLNREQATLRFFKKRYKDLKKKDRKLITLLYEISQANLVHEMHIHAIQEPRSAQSIKILAEMHKLTANQNPDNTNTNTNTDTNPKLSITLNNSNPNPDNPNPNPENSSNTKEREPLPLALVVGGSK